MRAESLKIARPLGEGDSNAPGIPSMPGSLYPWDEHVFSFIPSLDLVMGGHISNRFPGCGLQAMRGLLSTVGGWPGDPSLFLSSGQCQEHTVPF